MKARRGPGGGHGGLAELTARGVRGTARRQSALQRLDLEPPRRPLSARPWSRPPDRPCLSRGPPRVPLLSNPRRGAQPATSRERLLFASPSLAEPADQELTNHPELERVLTKLICR